MAMKPPVAFLSYAQFTDSREGEKLRTFAEELGRTVRCLWGEDVQILDRNDAQWRRQWNERIVESLDCAAFLLPIITPEYIQSEDCQNEFRRFLKREKDLKRSSLILPLYYVNCPLINDPVERASIDFARLLAQRYYQDWRDLNEQPNNTLEAGLRFDRVAEWIIEALERGGSLQPALASAIKFSPTGRAKTKHAVEGEASSIKPLVLVVDALGRGDYRSISAAIESAERGARIFVRPGTYDEILTIDKPLEIIGDGSREDIVIETKRKSSVTFRAFTGRIANLTLRQYGDGCFAVDIARGRLMLEDCDITSKGLSCVAIHNRAEPTVRRNRVYAGRQNGICIFGTATGLIEDNQIFANAFSGIEIAEGGNPTVRRNLIHAGGTSGVLVQRNGAGFIEENEILNNAASGIAVRWGGKPIVRRNHIAGNREGIRVYAGGYGTFEDNLFRGNVNTALVVARGCAANVKVSGNAES